MARSASRSPSGTSDRGARTLARWDALREELDGKGVAELDEWVRPKFGVFKQRLKCAELSLHRHSVLSRASCRYCGGACVSAPSVSGTREIGTPVSLLGLLLGLSQGHLNKSKQR